MNDIEKHAKELPDESGTPKAAWTSLLGPWRGPWDLRNVLGDASELPGRPLVDPWGPLGDLWGPLGGPW